MAEENKKIEFEATTQEPAMVNGLDHATIKPNVIIENKEKAKDKSGEIEIPTKFKKIVEEIEKMSVLDLNELVKVFEKKFGVSAQAMAMAAGPAMAGAVAPEQDIFRVELTSAGDKKIQVIKAVKEALALGLKEAKDLVDGVPSVLKEEVKKADAEAIKKTIEAAGGKIELK